MSTGGSADDAGAPAGSAPPPDPRYDLRFQRGSAAAGSAPILPPPPRVVAPPTAEPPEREDRHGAAADPAGRPSPEAAADPVGGPDAAATDPATPQPDARASRRPPERRVLGVVSLALVAVAAIVGVVAGARRDPFATRYTGLDFWRDEVLLPAVPALAAAGILGLALWLAIGIVAPRDRAPASTAEPAEHGAPDAAPDQRGDSR
ncbi:MAG: hypothetical protein J0G30_02590 [Actinomycetales bacterium]|nr:hypothetical protein [Actinomycetales bacterium]